MTTATPSAGGPAKRERDLRLDFFRGLAMFIILLAHTPGNSWTLWIPARFGFSDATEIFVFCSGMASGIAFGAVFLKKSWFLGAARIAFRVWQVYWAHIGIFLATALLMVVIDTVDFGAADKEYARWFPVAGLFTRTEETLLGLFTLTYIPGLFDILPMYLVILAMVPMVMAVYRFGGREAVFALVAVVWLSANLAGYARAMDGVEDMSPIQAGAAWLGSHLTWMNLPGVPWQENATWFFNPFGWQLVFFTGFAFTMGWFPAPPINRKLVIAAIAVVLITVPWAWFKMYQYLTGYIPDSIVGRFLWDSRETIDPVRWKTWVGLWRYVHFLAVGYLAFAAVGPGGVRLRTGWGVVWRSPATRFWIRVATGAVLILTAPYTYISEIKWVAPALDAWLLQTVPIIEGRYHGILHPDPPRRPDHVPMAFDRRPRAAMAGARCVPGHRSGHPQGRHAIAGGLHGVDRAGPLQRRLDGLDRPLAGPDRLDIHDRTRRLGAGDGQPDGIRRAHWNRLPCIVVQTATLAREAGAQATDRATAGSCRLRSRRMTR